MDDWRCEVDDEKAREHWGHGRGAKDDGANREEAKAEERASARDVRGRDMMVGITQKTSTAEYGTDRLCSGAVGVSKPSMFVTKVSLCHGGAARCHPAPAHLRANHKGLLGNDTKVASHLSSTRQLIMNGMLFSELAISLG